MNKKWIFIVASIVVVISACKKDFLDKTPDEDLTLIDVFSNFRYAESYLTSVYSNLPNELNLSDDPGMNPFVGATDEMSIGYSYPFSHQMVSGAWGPSNTPINIWGNMYIGIRKTNLFLENVDKIPLSTAFNKERRDVWKGEAFFLRAFYHFMLMRVYGPIVIARQSYTVETDFSALRRQTMDECVDFVVNQCDTALKFLPANVPGDGDYGRATIAAALALKSRVLLYAASPLWNGNPDYVNFKDNKGTNLFSANYDQDKWKKAANAAKECIDQTQISGYQIYGQNNTTPVLTRQNLFLDNNNREIFFSRNIGLSRLIEAASATPRFGDQFALAGYSPTQELVDAYEMKDGKRPILGYNDDHSPKLNAESDYKESGYASSADPDGNYPVGVSNMYVGREPRFYADINFTGAIRRGLQFDFKYSGIDGHQKNKDGYTKTGYLIKKFVDQSFDLSNIGNPGVRKTWVYFRLGEQYLNYAEALNEYMPGHSDITKYINLIRKRAGLPGISGGVSQAEMREKIRHERRVELAFETHRYFDLRRWKIAEVIDGQPVYGMNTEGDGDNYFQRTKIENRIFSSPKHYLWPISQSEINQNHNIVQNPGW